MQRPNVLKPEYDLPYIYPTVPPFQPTYRPEEPNCVLVRDYSGVGYGEYINTSRTEAVYRTPIGIYTGGTGLVRRSNIETSLRMFFSIRDVCDFYQFRLGILAGLYISLATAEATNRRVYCVRACF